MPLLFEIEGLLAYGKFVTIESLKKCFRDITIKLQRKIGSLVQLVKQPEGCTLCLEYACP